VTPVVVRTNPSRRLDRTVTEPHADTTDE